MIIKNSISRYLYQKYYIFLYIAYIIFVFIPQARVGVIASVITSIVFIATFPIKVRGVGIWVIVLMVWGLSTILLIDLNINSLSRYASKYLSAYFPMLFYFLGEKKSHRLNDKDFYYYFKIALYICFIIGMFWYITEPTYYINYMERTTAGFHLASYHNDKRFSSFLGSIGIGLLSISGMILFLNQYFKYRLFRDFFGAVCMITMCILSMQRSSYVMLVIFFSWIILRQKRTIMIKVFIILFFLITLTILAMFLVPVNENNIMNQLFGRIDKIDIKRMITERSDSWWQVFNLNGKIIVGGGVGFFTQGSLYTINDGAFFNILGEVGLVGLTLFFYIVFYSIIQAKRSNVLRENISPLMIIIAFLLNGIGSNGLLYMDLAPLFWFSVGRIKEKQIDRVRILP